MPASAVPLHDIRSMHVEITCSNLLERSGSLAPIACSPRVKRQIEGASCFLASRKHSGLRQTDKRGETAAKLVPLNTGLSISPPRGG